MEEPCVFNSKKETKMVHIIKLNPYLDQEPRSFLFLDLLLFWSRFGVDLLPICCYFGADFVMICSRFAAILGAYLVLICS